MTKEMNFDFNQPEGLMMVGLPDKTLLLVRAISERTGHDMATVISNSLTYMAMQVLSREEQLALHERLK